MARPSAARRLLAPRPVASAEIKALRARVGLSQSEFASCLHLSTVLVQAWECGRRSPRGAALRLLELARRHPDLVFTFSPTTHEAPATRDAPAPRSAPRRGAPARSSLTDRLIAHLADHGVGFVVIGGIAAGLRGAPGSSDDLDIVYDRSPANLARLGACLRALETTLRGVPGAIPFSADPRTLAHTSVLSLDTRLGALDLRQRVAGVGEFAAAHMASTPVTIAGRRVDVINLDALITSKRATGRSKDRDEVASWEAKR